MSANKGYKQPSVSDFKGKKKGKNIPRCSPARKGKDLSFNLPSEFPDMATIHSLTSKGIHHPQIFVSQLQRVG
jgi:hypothetical protein